MNYCEMMCNMTGYRMQTTFWDDFTIADKFGESGIYDTYKRAFNEWKSEYKYLTELVMVLNWKCWEHYENNNTQLSKIYGELFYKTRDYAWDNLTDDELSYFSNTID